MMNQRKIPLRKSIKPTRYIMGRIKSEWEKEDGEKQDKWRI